MHWRKLPKRVIQIIFFGLIFLFALGPAAMPLNDPEEKIRAYTRAEEFDYVTWTIDALKVKLGRATLQTNNYLTLADQKQIVLDYLELIRTIQLTEAELSLVFTDPEITDTENAAAPIRERLAPLYDQREQLGPLAESILQEMLSATVAKMGFTLGGQPIPPVMYHSTPLPWALIVSPRDEIRQEANISLETRLTIEDHIRIEDQISQEMDYSTLVVPVGGVGTYPTMVAESTNLNWLAEVISHEWAHNYLTLRPLGVRYDQTPELRTINETTASIFGNEIGAIIIETYFPELAPPPPALADDTSPQPAPEPPAFDFREEMHQTRIRVDELLASGDYLEAEEYMEQRRKVFWENGYRIRKLNQAYFAFYGAYADQPTGSAGEDPVGAAVRQLRAQSNSLLEFMQAVSQVKSYQELQGLLE
ncbi:MAG: hypothetical protein JW757_11965 [Anaerolineales bacterium]|nr:hypothetical protein [Anaerolineales bacterium]